MKTDDGDFVSWRKVPPRQGETVRWEHVDRRWIALSLGFGASRGKVLVSDSTGRSEAADGIEAALALACAWRSNISG